MTDFHEALPEDLRDNEALKDFKDVGGLAKAFLDTKKAYTEGQTAMSHMVKVPGEDATPEDRDRFWNKIGRPEKADDYKLDLPKIEGQTYDEAKIGEFKKKMHSLGLTGQQTQSVMSWYLDDMKNSIEKGNADAGKAEAEVDATLRSEWGPEYDANQGRISKAIDIYFEESARDPIKQILKGSPALARALAKVGADISEDRSSRPGSSGGGEMDSEGAKEKINEIRANKEHPYHDRRKPGHKEALEEMNGLYQIAYAEDK